MRPQGEADTSALRGFQQRREVLGNISDATVQRFIVRGRPSSTGEVFAKFLDPVSTQETVNLHPTETVLKRGMASVLFFASVRKVFKGADDGIVHVLSVVIGDAAVWSYVFEKVAEC